MKVLRTYILANFGGGLIDETAELKLVAQVSETPTLQEVTGVGNETTNEINSTGFNVKSYDVNNVVEITDDGGVGQITLKQTDGNDVVVLSLLGGIIYSKSGIINAIEPLPSNKGFVVFSSEPNPVGLSGSSDFSPNITDLDYTQKIYVDNLNKPIVVSSSQTAILNRVHNVVANATLTDPTPVEGMGYNVNVINGVATVGGVDYSVGSELYRHYHSGSWRTFEYLANKNKLLRLASNYSLAGQTAYQKLFNIDDTGGSAGTVNVVAGTYLAFFNLAFSGLPAGTSQVRLRLNNGSATISVYSASVSSSNGFNAAPSGQFSFIDNTLVGTFIPTAAGGITSRSIGFFAMINFTSAGTFLPEFGITASTTGMTVLANSFFTLTKI